MILAGAGRDALEAGGGALVVIAVVDMFLTIFNYDGYTTLTTFFHRTWWRLARAFSAPLPTRARHVALSLASAAMLPATVAVWLGVEITGFALLFDGGLSVGSFALNGAGRSLGAAFYLSAGAISSLTFGDVTARGGGMRALVDLETIVGLATFTLALGYVVTAFGLLGALETLHGRVRRHADDLDRPESIVRRHFRGGSPDDLPSLLQALSDDLEGYDQGLRRYPVVYYFHTRRARRSTPHVFTAIGDLVALLRWGLPAGESIADDAFLYALHDGYEQTLDRLRDSFVGPDPIRLPEPVARDEFARAYAESGGRNRGVDAFRELQRRGHEAAAAESSAGDADTDADTDAEYERYRRWLPFAYKQRIVLERVADRLGYARPEPVAAP